MLRTLAFCFGLSGMWSRIAWLHYLLNLGSAPVRRSSGAISGIVGAFAVLYPRAKFDLDVYLGWWH